MALLLYHGRDKERVAAVDAVDVRGVWPVKTYREMPSPPKWIVVYLCMCMCMSLMVSTTRPKKGNPIAARAIRSIKR